MEQNKIIPSQDLVFQRIFGKPGNEKITERLLNLILEKEIVGIDLDANKRLLDGAADDKVGRLDIRAKLKSGEDFNIELQMSPYEYMPERMAYYWSKIYSGKLKRGKKYDKLTPTTCILIANYNLDELVSIPKYHTIWNLREKDYHQVILTRDIEFHILEIPKMLKENPDLRKDELATWLKFLIEPDDREVKTMAREITIMEQAMEELKDLRDDPYFMDLVIRREMAILDEISFRAAAEKKGRQEGRQKGLKEGMQKGMQEGMQKGMQEGMQKGMQKGIKEGIEKNRRETCKKLLAMNMPIKDIVQITELSEQEIEKLRKEA